MPEVVSVGNVIGGTKHALAGALQVGETYVSAWTYTGTNRTACGYLARGCESMASGRGLEVSCLSCKRATSLFLERAGLEIGTWEFHTRPQDGAKFASVAAERLYDWSLESAQDQECGQAEVFGWFALFERERAILSADSQGFVSAVRYSDADLFAEWQAIEDRYEEYDDLMA